MAVTVIPNRISSLPRYITIADRIRRSISIGKLAHAAKLPSQRELAETYSTTVMTIRQALALLEEENLITTTHGVGSFVSNSALDVDLYHLLSFRDEMSQQALAVETHLLTVETECQNEVAARALGLSDDASVCMIQRLRWVADQPIVFQSSFLPPWLMKVAQEYSPDSSLYEQLQQKAGQVATMAKEVLYPIALTPEQAVQLQRPTGEAAFFSVRLSTNQDGVPVAYDEAVMVGDRFVISTERIGRRTGFRVCLAAHDAPDVLSLLTE